MAESRKLTVEVDLCFKVAPNNSYDWESDEWLRGLVTSLLSNAGLPDMIDNVGAKLKQGMNDNERACDSLQLTHSIQVGDLNGKKKTGKFKTEVKAQKN